MPEGSSEETLSQILESLREISTATPGKIPRKTMDIQGKFLVQYNVGRKSLVDSMRNLDSNPTKIAMKELREQSHEKLQHKSLEALQ